MDVDNNGREHPYAYASWRGGAESYGIDDSWVCSEEEERREESDVEVACGFGSRAWGHVGEPSDLTQAAGAIAVYAGLALNVGPRGNHKRRRT